MTRKFVADDITGSYTSDVIKGNFNNNSNQTRGVIQVSFTSGTVDLQMRLSVDAPFYTVKQYTASVVEEVVLANEMRIVVAGVAEAWISETL